jgi:hypothetical protein
MSVNGKIANELRQIVLGDLDFSNTPMLMSGTVTGVHEATRTCTVLTLSGGQSVELGGVRLMAVVEDGLLLLPAVDSNVMVLCCPKEAPVVVQYSKLDKTYLQVGKTAITVVDGTVTVEIGGSSQTITDGLIKFNAGSNDGLVKVTELTQQINLIEQDLNTLKGILTAILAVTNALPPAVPVLGSVLTGIFTPYTPYASAMLTPTMKAQIEDPKVTH